MLDACCSVAKWIGPEAVDELLGQADLVREDTDAITVTPWIFAFEGLDPEAARIYDKQDDILFCALLTADL